MSDCSDPVHLLANPRTGRIAGGVLLGTAILTIVAMAHHPTGHAPPGTGFGMTLGASIHTAMLILLAATLWGLTVFALRQGLGGWALAGLLAYGTSFTAHTAAGLINGFIVPAVAERAAPASGTDLFMMLWQANQAAARLGIYAASAAIAAWSIMLLRQRRPASLLTGSLGFVAAIGPAVALYGNVITLDVEGALVAYGAHAMWTGLVGLQMLRRAL